MKSFFGDSLKMLCIRILRFYVMHTPVEKGRWRIGDLINQCARAVGGNRSLVIKSRDGRWFNMRTEDRQYTMGLLSFGDFEPEESAVVSRYVKNGDVVIDAGANFGWYTTLFSRLVGDQGCVHAFEPVPTTTNNLKENCELNSCTNVTVNNMALGDVEGTCRISYLPDSPSGDASMFGPRPGAGLGFQCRMITLDKYLKENGITRCDFIKCDVEGAEVMAMRGARETLRSLKPIVLMELNPERLLEAGHTAEDLFAEVNRHGGYRFVAIEKAGERNMVPEEADFLESYINVLAIPDETH